MHIDRLRTAPILTFTRSTIRMYIKERVLLVVLIFGFVLMVSSHVLAPLAVGAQQKIIVDIGLASISLFGVLLVILLGASSFSREKDGGILTSLLARPVSRVDFVIGKYFGTVITIVMVMFLMAMLYALIAVISGTALNAMAFRAMYLSVIEVALLTAVMSFFSSFSTPMLSAFFTLCVFVSGHLSKDLFQFADHVGGVGFKIVSSVAYYVLPNLALFNIRSEAVHDLPLMDGYSSSATIYAAFYASVLLFLASLIFRRKDVV
jgi:ABC-type transport system involved in multi-copper enzyme maturation permease subunit